MAGRWGPNFFHIFTFLKFRNLFSGQGQRNVSFLTFFVILGIRQSFRDGICQDPFNQIFGIGFDLVWSLENTILEQCVKLQKMFDYRRRSSFI